MLLFLAVLGFRHKNCDDEAVKDAETVQSVPCSAKQDAEARKAEILNDEKVVANTLRHIGEQRCHAGPCNEEIKTSEEGTGYF